MKVLYTGSFNPFHNGHEYVYNLACQMFGKDNVWIGIGQNSDKKNSDLEHLKFSIKPITQNVIAYSNLTAQIVFEHKFDLLIRGIRPGFSLDQENQLLYWNKIIANVDTILIPTPPEVNQISSGAIRELVKHNVSVHKFMNHHVHGRWLQTEPKIDVYFGKCCSGKSTYLKQQKNYNVVEFDRAWKNYISTCRPEFLEEQLELAKTYFYNKDIRFKEVCGSLAGLMQWSNLFLDWKQPPTFDFPAIGTYWHYIPENIRSRLRLIKCTASDYDRYCFAESRNVNDKLIECNNFFYQDPPFWDEEIIIKKM